MNKLCLTALGAVLISLATPVASASQIVVGLFGGTFETSSQTCHIKPFEAENNVRVLTKLGNSAQFAAAVRATRGKSDYDVIYVDNSLAAQLKNEGLLEIIDTKQISNYDSLTSLALDADNQYIAFMTASTAIAYDTTQITNPPKSWKDLFKPEYSDKLAIGDISGTAGMHFLLALNRAEGGTIENMDAGFEAIKPLAKASGQLYTQADQIIPMFERKEIALAVWYPDRAGAAIDAGMPLAVVYPEEGAVGILPTIAIPKGAKNPELAHKYIDYLLSVEGQKCFAEAQYAGPVNKNVELSDKVASILAVGDDLEKLWLPDPVQVAEQLPGWIKRWQREVAR